MAGKTRKQKRIRAKTNKQLKEQLVQKKVRASRPEDEANNNAEPSPPSAETVNEDAQKDARMEAMAEAEELESKPFDPQETIAKLLKKNGT